MQSITYPKAGDCLLPNLLKEQPFQHLRDVDAVARERKARGTTEEMIFNELIYE